LHSLSVYKFDLELLLFPPANISLDVFHFPIDTSLLLETKTRNSANFADKISNNFKEHNSHRESLSNQRMPWTETINDFNNGSNLNQHLKSKDLSDEELKIIKYLFSLDEGSNSTIQKSLCRFPLRMCKFWQRVSFSQYTSRSCSKKLIILIAKRFNSLFKGFRKIFRRSLRCSQNRSLIKSNFGSQKISPKTNRAHTLSKCKHSFTFNFS